jgi:hypothetical protein
VLAAAREFALAGPVPETSGALEFLYADDPRKPDSPGGTGT